MTTEQVQLVQQSFSQVEPVIDLAVIAFYDRLFTLDPGLRHLFRTPPEEQARKLAHVLRMVVKSLDRLDQIVPAVKELGRRHAGYGVEDGNYATVGEALLWTLGQGLGEGFTPAVKSAWAAAYGLLATTMQEAAHGVERGGAAHKAA